MKNQGISQHSPHIEAFTDIKDLFGITSAPEKYQNIIKDVLQGCPGVANIADDLIIHGKGLEEHDRHLFGVLKRLKECGLTLNAGKCQFWLITRAETLAYFKNNCKSRIDDAGPTGLGCCPFCNNSMSCGGLCHMHPET